METVNLTRSVLVCNIFHFCFSAAKASLIPFLTIFCRLIGLSATETGIIMAAKTVTGFVWAPLWSKCAIAYNKRRTVLMFSLFIMAATYLSLSLVFSHLKNAKTMCPTPRNGHGGNTSQSYVSTAMATHPPVSKHIENAVKDDSVADKLTTASALGKGVTNVTTTTTKATPTTILTTTTKITRSSTTLPPPTTVKGKEPSATGSPVSDRDKSVNETDAEIVGLVKKMLKQIGYSIKDIKDNKVTAEEAFVLITTHYPDTGLSQAVFNDLWPKLMKSDGKSSHKVSHRDTRDIHETWNSLRDKMTNLVTEIEERKMEVFLIVLVVVMLGEFMCSPVEKVADDSWFDFLDRVDDLEKYGKQRLSGSIAFTIFPLIVSLAVDYSNCLLPYDIHHFLIHFYVFGVFIGLTFLIAFFYPVPPPEKKRTKSKVVRGLQIICCDCRGFLYVVTLLIMGGTYASVHNYLFWLIQDRGGKEVNMGLCVTIGAFVEIPMLMFSGKLVNKIGNAGVVTLSLLAMTTRTLYYSFLWVPWAVLPAELLHAFTHTAMWYAILSYDDFNVGPAVDRSIRSILSSVYFGVGFSAGSVFSGILYDLFGISVLYWTGSILTGIWALVYLVISLCLPKKEKIRYVRLLRTEDADDSDGDADDWLEMALKDQ
ncbi:major facilitator superfamily domain-containing protein 6-like protein B [Haliotis cracherodii]|uniref:major facilitator superfamily domain-containing protein 6-like protein B n=1 Tax=Haliotis cracherodii TaxID=6455 RepID=UPI0039E7FE6B